MTADVAVMSGLGVRCTSKKYSQGCPVGRGYGVVIANLARPRVAGRQTGRRGAGLGRAESARDTLAPGRQAEQGGRAGGRCAVQW